MGRQRDGAKELYWRELIRKWECSALSTGEFCWQHEIEQHQLHAWRRTLERRDAEAQAGGARHSSHRSGSVKPSATNLAQRKSCDTSAGNAFVQVLLPTDSGVTAELEITHPGGCRIRIRQACDQHLLSGVLAALDARAEHPAGGL